MQTSDKGIVALLAHEGIVPGPYLDSVGVWTYGVGHTAAAGAPIPTDMARGMPTDLDAELIRVFDVFRKDLAKYEREVAAAVTAPMAQHEFDAAVSFHFNTGAIGRASWVKSFNTGHKDKAAAQILNWKKPAEIIPRRRDEQSLFRTGKYPEASITVWGVTEAGRVVWSPERRLTASEALGLLRGAANPDVEPPAPANEMPKQGVLAAFIAFLKSLTERRT